MKDSTRGFIGLMIAIAAALFIVGIWTNDERWGGTAAVVLGVGVSPWLSHYLRGR
ncbi:membrane protein [Arthrobacter phage Rizwana]|nr:membrane protein [Arthrobacter phage Rizwana]